MATYNPTPGRAAGAGPTQNQAWYHWLGVSDYKQQVQGARNRANELRTIDAAAADAMDQIISQYDGGSGYFRGSWDAYWALGDIYDSAWTNYNTQQQQQAQRQQEEALAAQKAAEAEQARLAREAEQQRVFHQNQKDLAQTNLRPGADSGTGLASRLLGGTALEEGRQSSVVSTPRSAGGSSSTPAGDESDSSRKNRKRGGLSAAVGINL